MTEEEFKERRTQQRTTALAVKCANCGNIDEIDSRFSDGNFCTKCGGGPTLAIGYLKPIKRPPTHRNQYEALEQAKLFQWAFYQRAFYPELELLFHIPNGGSRNKKEAANLKRQGVKSGVPDLFLPIPRKERHGLFIELKYGKNKTTDNQDRWITLLKEQGYIAEVCYGWEQAAETITKYLKLTEA